MSLYVTSINSGSNGNCYYIANETEAVLIDAGISCRETEKRMTRIGLSMENVKAIFISHEHSDHINGVEVLSKKYEIPVYITRKTLVSGGLQIPEKQRQIFKANQPIFIGDLSITAFPKFHDAIDPYSFVVSGNGVNIGVLTDIGSVCENVIKNFSQCHACFLETNYDEQMLEFGNYPFHLKKRIKSDVGHLSNDQALELFVNHRSSSLSHVFLSHLSKENNSPKLVQDLFTQHAGNTEVVVASRYSEIDVYEIKSDFVSEVSMRAVSVARKSYQMKLF